MGDSTSEVISDQLREGDTVVLSGSSTITSSNGNPVRGTFEQGGDIEGPVFFGP
jgi:hypothetical protein